MPYIYATALPGDIVKLGRCTDERVRPFAAQMFYAERIELLALWPVRHARDEDRALWACREWHVRGELFRIPTSWLDAEHPAVRAVSIALGPPVPRKEMPKAPTLQLGLRIVRPPISRRKEKEVQSIITALRPRRPRGRPSKGGPDL